MRIYSFWRSLSTPSGRGYHNRLSILQKLTIVNTDLREEQDRLQEQIRIQETEKAEKKAEAQLLDQNAETLRQIIRETEQRLAADESRKKTFEHYESKLSGMKKKLTSHRQTQEKTKEFLAFHGLAEEYDRFLANDGRISVRDRLSKNHAEIKQNKPNEIVREKVFSTGAIERLAIS